eukprot:gene18868-6239_t
MSGYVPGTHEIPVLDRNRSTRPRVIGRKLMIPLCAFNPQIGHPNHVLLPVKCRMQPPPTPCARVGMPRPRSVLPCLDNPHGLWIPITGCIAKWDAQAGVRTWIKQ